MSNFLPDNYTIPTKSKYTKLQPGENTIRFLEAPILGYELWCDKKPMRYAMDEKISMNDFNRADKDEYGQPKKPRHFWAAVVWNYDQNSLQIWEITQKSIITALMALIKSKAWGNPMDYDVLVTKKGQGKDTEYTVMPGSKEPVSESILSEYESAKINISKLFTGEDPFAAVDSDDLANDAVEALR